MADRGRRIGILGFDLEANRFAPVSGRADFEEKWYYEGAAISREARAEHPAIHGGIVGFHAAMDKAGPWTPAPILFTGTTPNGPVEQDFFEDVLTRMRAGLHAALPLDGVYICEHGAAVATESLDPDGDLFQMVRRAVGPDVPVIATLDLHANISERMVLETDVLIGYRTNPHVDQFERGEEAASCMLELLSGVTATAASVRLPMVLPTVVQLTAEGQPLGDLIRLGQSRMDADIMNVSILSGFSFSDTPKNGMHVVVTARNDLAKARALAHDLAAEIWRARSTFRVNMISLERAIELALEAGRNPAKPALLFADPADNPGGGGRGNTTHILRAFLDAGVRDALLGVFCDAALVEQAFAAGEGNRFRARLNTQENERHSEPYEADATVLALSDGVLVPRHGMMAGRTVRLGPSCAIEIGGVAMVAVSARQQCLSADFLEHLGLDVGAARSVIVKSRGHFRAGFAHLFAPAQIHEVDVPGLTAPNLANFEWRHLPRPVYPLDPDAAWPPAGADIA